MWRARSSLVKTHGGVEWTRSVTSSATARAWALTDVKSAPPVRPGAPSFGRAIGESPQWSHEEGELSTAQRRAGLLQHDLIEKKKMQNEARIVSDMEGKFFARPEPEAGIVEAPARGNSRGHTQSNVHVMEEGGDMPASSLHTAAQDSLMDDDGGPTKAPSRYSPRGSYIDVRA